MKCNPFILFPKAVETASLVKYRAAGLDPDTLTDSLRVIVKKATTSDEPSEYGVRSQAWSIHIDPVTIPEPYNTRPELLLDFVVKLQDGRAYLINEASRGDDFDTGSLEFISVLAQPYGRNTL